ncbi:glycosyltransferase family A protein [Photobacterium leiognathi]|uniref:glycosyltransferase family A protein n=1 Tax=Photobacterium leiognathi TaxID=553611 RepID=UPI0034E93E22
MVELKYIRCIKIQEQTAARNYGAYMSSFDILCFLDSDDIWKNNKLKEQSLLYKKNH